MSSALVADVHQTCISSVHVVTKRWNFCFFSVRKQLLSLSGFLFHPAWCSQSGFPGWRNTDAHQSRTTSTDASSCGPVVRMHKIKRKKSSKVKGLCRVELPWVGSLEELAASSYSSKYLPNALKWMHLACCVQFPACRAKQTIIVDNLEMSLTRYLQ